MGDGKASFPYTSRVALVITGSRRELHWFKSKGCSDRASSKDLPACTERAEDTALRHRMLHSDEVQHMSGIVERILVSLKTTEIL